MTERARPVPSRARCRRSRPRRRRWRQTLRRHIAAIAAREHNMVHYDELEKVARYLEATLASFGYAVGRQEFVGRWQDGAQHRRHDRAAPERPIRRSIVVGAHYDSARGTPGANDNAQRQRPRSSNSRGCCAICEAASGKRIRLVLFVNEEPPYFRTEAMGSLQLRRARSPRRGERVVAMYSLETLGFYSERAGQPALSCTVRPDVSRSRRLRRVRRSPGLAGAVAEDDAVVPLAHRASRQSAASHRLHAGHRLVGSLGFRGSKAFRP